MLKRRFDRSQIDHTEQLRLELMPAPAAPEYKPTNAETLERMLATTTLEELDELKAYLESQPSWSSLGLPELDRIIIETHDRLEIVRPWYEPPNLKGWTAIDFRVLP